MNQLKLELSNSLGLEAGTLVLLYTHLMVTRHTIPPTTPTKAPKLTEECMLGGHIPNRWRPICGIFGLEVGVGCTLCAHVDGQLSLEVWKLCELLMLLIRILSMMWSMKIKRPNFSNEQERVKTNSRKLSFQAKDGTNMSKHTQALYISFALSFLSFGWWSNTSS